MKMEVGLRLVADGWRIGGGWFQVGGGWVEDWFRKRKRDRIEREDSLGGAP